LVLVLVLVVGFYGVVGESEMRNGLSFGLLATFATGRSVTVRRICLSLFFFQDLEGPSDYNMSFIFGIVVTSSA
jgi:hypothetical protein